MAASWRREDHRSSLIDRRIRDLGGWFPSFRVFTRGALDRKDQTDGMLLEDAGELVSASFVTVWRGAPLLAFAVTHPRRKGQGLSRLCTHAVPALGYPGAPTEFFMAQVFAGTAPQGEVAYHAAFASEA